MTELSHSGDEGERSAVLRCRWCRRVLPPAAKTGRPRRFCRQACRQWDWVARQRARDLALSEDELVRKFGKTGRFYYQIVRGIDERPVQPHRLTKSLGAEDTFEQDLETADEMLTELEQIAEKVTERLERNKLKGKTLTLKIKFNDFKQITRNQSFANPIGDYFSIYAAAKELLLKAEMNGKTVRLLGISLSNFGNTVQLSKLVNPNQLELF